MTILISGVAGFIGSHLAQRFLRQGNQVFGFDNLSNQYPTNYYQNNLKILKAYPNFKFKKLNLLDNNGLEKFLEKTKIDYLIHAAAKTGITESLKKPKEFFRINVDGTLNLANLVLSVNNKCRIIAFSSSSVYGKQLSLPIKETASLKPLSPYGESKKQMEQQLARLAYQKKLNVIVIRPFSIYGPRGRRDMAPYLFYHAVKDSKPFTIFGNNQTNQRDWTYIDDFVDCIAKMVQKKLDGFQVFNLGAGFPIGIEDFVKQAATFFPDKAKVKIIKKPTRNYETNITWADNNKALKAFSLRSKTIFQEGILKTFAAFKDEEN